MEPKELMKALMELIYAKTPEEKMGVLKRFPELLDKESIEMLRNASRNAKLSSNEEAASLFESSADLLAEFSKSISGTVRGNASSANLPPVVWARLAREHLTLRKNDLLEQAIVSSQQDGEKEAASILRAYQIRRKKRRSNDYCSIPSGYKSAVCGTFYPVPS